MKLDPYELRELIIRPTLEYLGCHSNAVENLLVAVAQYQSGDMSPRSPSCLGIYPIDAEAHQKVWDDHLAFDPDLASRIRGLASQREFLIHPHQELCTNLAYATAIAWAIYLMFPQVLPRPEGLTPPAGTQSLPPDYKRSCIELHRAR